MSAKTALKTGNRRVKGKKVTFTMPEHLVAELDGYAEAAGMARANYVNMAVLIGMRALARQISPEAFVTPELIEKMRAAGYVMPEKLNDEK